jgi:SWI/SNF-related matrix-associated actin-dependent regulator 1 of chromatin subfamily A
MKSATVSNNKIAVTFNYSPLLVADVKNIPGRKYSPDTRTWTFPICQEGVSYLETHNFPIPIEIIKWKRNRRLRPIEVPGLKKELYPFQKLGVSFLESKNGNALIADDMGLGKTIQFLAYLQLHPELRPAIIICPANVKYNWAKEIDECLPKENAYENYIEIINGQTIYEIGRPSIVIINYDLLTYWTNILIELESQIICADESHYFANIEAQRTQSFLKLKKQVRKFTALSGTPIKNRPKEFFITLNAINSKEWNTWTKYAHTYCGTREQDFRGAINTKELNKKLLDTVMLRRLKKDVLDDLPDKTRAVIPIEIKGTEEYITALNEFRIWLKTHKNSNEALAQIEKLKQLAVKAKLKQCIEWIENFLKSNNKLIVFCHHKIIVQTLERQFARESLTIDGGTAPKTRIEIIKQFQTDPSITLFIGTAAAKEGITLTAASNICFLELWWSSSAHNQAEDRAYRIGQKKAVNIYYLIAKDTIEEDIVKLLDKKRKVVDMVLDGKKTEEQSLLKKLMKQYSKED